MDEEGVRDEDLKLRQDPQLYPLGQALRATFDADNHATLGKDVTGLMLDLSHVPYEPHEFPQASAAAQTAARDGLARSGVLARVRLMLLARRRTALR